MKINEIPVCAERQKSHVKYCKCVMTLNKGFLWCSLHKRYKSSQEINRKAFARTRFIEQLVELGAAEYHGESD